MKYLKSILFFSCLLTTNISFAENLPIGQFNQPQSSSLSSVLSFDQKETPLSAEEAFKLSSNLNEKTVSFDFTIADKHYLYVDQFEFYINGKKKDLTIENTIEKEDLHYGKVKVVKDYLNISFVNDEEVKNYKLIYQGCSEQFNICYDKQKYEFFIPDTNVIKEDILIKEQIKEQNENIITTNDKKEQDLIQITQEEISIKKKIEAQIEQENKKNSYVGSEDYIKNILQNSQLWEILFIFFIGGILISFTPCVLPMIPIVSSIVLGKDEQISQIKAFSLSLSYVLGSSVTYASLGLIAALLSENIQAYMQNIYVIITFSSILFLLGLSMLGLFNINGSQKINNIAYQYSNKLKGGEHIQVFIMGMLSTLILSPCVAAPIAAAITYISTTNDVLTGTLSMFVFGLGIGFILILITTTLNKFKIKSGNWMNEIKYITGVIIILVSIYLLSSIVKEEYIYMAYVSTIIGYFISLFGRNYQKLKNLLIILIISIFAAIYFKPQIDNNNYDILKVQNIEELNNALKGNKYSILKFTADWCVYCRQMDKEIFKNKKYEEQFKNYKVIYVDITEENEESKKIKEKYNVFAPPVIVFLENNDIVYKEIGYNKDKLINIIDKINIEIKKIGEKNGR